MKEGNIEVYCRVCKLLPESLLQVEESDMGERLHGVLGGLRLLRRSAANTGYYGSTLF